MTININGLCKYLGPVWIRGIYAIFVFSPKYIFAKVGVVWICGIWPRKIKVTPRKNSARKARKYILRLFVPKYILAKIRK
jgi:hypothetical protein